jgi:hypothetical protein
MVRLMMLFSFFSQHFEIPERERHELQLLLLRKPFHQDFLYRLIAEDKACTRKFPSLYAVLLPWHA